MTRPRRTSTVLALFVALLTLAHAASQAPRSLLSGRVTHVQLSGMLASADAWHPYPKIHERAEWDAVPEAIRVAFIRDAASQLGKPWGSIPATVALAFARNGNRNDYDRVNTERRQRLTTMLMAEVFENRGRFLDEIVNGIWAISEQTFWGSMAHMSLQKAGVGLPDAREPVVDLFAAETASLFAWADYLLGARLDTVSPRIRERIHFEVDRRVLTPALERDDFWWMGFGPRRDVNNWNPWINSNWLTSVLILERDPQRRARATYKIMRSLDRFLDPYPEDGSCDEGPSYWDRAGGSLFDNLELLRSATSGAIDIYDTPLVRNVGQYIYRVYVKDDWFLNTGDAPARVKPDAELIYRYGQRVNDPILQGFGAFVGQRRGMYGPGSSTPGRVIPAVLMAKEIATAKAIEPLPGEVWLPDLQLMAARAEPGSSRGLYVAAFGGHNGQSHNHNDVGSLFVFADGRPVLIDVGVETYTAKTFSAQRYDIWTMQSAYHNLPTINGVMQKDGAQYRAARVTFTPSPDVVRFSLDIAQAYPAEAKVSRWQRTVELKRASHEFDLTDAFVLSAFAQPVRLSLMTPLLVDTSVAGEVRLREPAGARQYALRYDSSRLSASSEQIPITDARLKSSWGDRLARVTLISKSTALRDEYRITMRYP
jgi:hypothetical protein